MGEQLDALNEKIRVLELQKSQLRGILNAMLDGYSCFRHEGQMRKMQLREMQELFPDKCVMCEREKHKKQARKSIAAFEQMFPDLVIVPSYHAVPPGYVGFALAAKSAQDQPQDQPEQHTTRANGNNK